MTVLYFIDSALSPPHVDDFSNTERERETEENTTQIQHSWNTHCVNSATQSFLRFNWSYPTERLHCNGLLGIDLWDNLHRLNHAFFPGGRVSVICAQINPLINDWGIVRGLRRPKSPNYITTHAYIYIYHGIIHLLWLIFATRKG